jgi:hypothetical protein
MNEPCNFLPAEFAALEPFAPGWGQRESAEARCRRRETTGMAELRSFYDAMTPIIERVLDHLDRNPFDAPLDEPDARLYRMTLSLIEVAEAVEIFRQPAVPLTEPRHAVTISWSREA